MARFLAPGLSLILYLLPFNLNLHLSCCDLFYLWTSTYTHRVFVFTGFGLNTFTADTTGTARYPFAISKWHHLFSAITKFDSESSVTILQLHSEKQDDCNLAIRQPPEQSRCLIHPLPAFHLPAPLPELLLLETTAHKFLKFLCQQSTNFIPNRNTFCHGIPPEQRRQLYSK